MLTIKGSIDKIIAKKPRGKQRRAVFMDIIQFNNNNV